MENFKFRLGQKVKDTITGLEGIIIYRTEWLTNCNTYGLRGKVKKGETKVPDLEQFDEPCLTIINKVPVKLNIPLKKARETGGPTPIVRKTNTQ